MFVSVIIPTYNPDLVRLGQTLTGLKEQRLDRTLWELIIVDNNSSDQFAGKIDIGWRPDIKQVKEPRQGLTYARLKGFDEAKGDIIVMLDDDNIPEKNYLGAIKNIFEENPELGAIGGKSVPLFEAPEPEWLGEFYGSLALRDLGDEVIIEKWNNKYPAAAPIGAGMAIRTAALKSYIKKTARNQQIITDRTGSSLGSGGDNDIVLEISKSGWLTGYFPSLIIKHIIPEYRMQPAYLARLVNDTNKSWVQLLESHSINPWKKITRTSVGLRKLKAWFNYKAWQSKPAYIRWQGACGTFEGLGDLCR